MIYFFIEDSNEQVKIGRAKDIERRRKGLQTGNPRKLLLLGWIRTDDDVRLEKEIHQNFSHLRGTDGFVGTTGDSFEVIGNDRDGVPEYLGVWNWGNLEWSECCPFCGSFCGMHFQDASSMYHCLNCDTLTTFDFLSHQEEE